MDIYDLFKFDRENERVLNLLLNRYKKNPYSIIPFIGAGMTAFAYPTWASFLYDSYDKLYEEQRIDGFQNLRYEDAAEFLKNARTTLYFTQDLIDAFNDDVLNDYDLSNQTISIIPQIFKSTIITTNFDRTIEKLIPSIPVGRPLDSEMLVRALSNDLQFLFKFHGCISRVNDSIVLTKNDYDKYYSEDSKLVKNMTRIFQTKHIMFLGCSLSEDRTVNLLERVFEEGNSHYAIITCTESERMETRIRLSNKGIYALLIPQGEYGLIADILSSFTDKKESTSDFSTVQDLYKQSCSLPPISFEKGVVKANFQEAKYSINIDEYISYFEENGFENAVAYVVKHNSEKIIEKFVEANYVMFKNKLIYILTRYLINTMMNYSMFSGISSYEIQIIEKNYYPLVLLRDNVKIPYKHNTFEYYAYNNQFKNANGIHCVNENSFEFINCNKRILIVDNAGMGKSTLLRYVACLSIRLSQGVPILVELRKLGNRTINEYIYDEFTSYGIDICKEDFDLIMKNESLIFLFDGVDELFPQYKDGIINEINRISLNNRNCRIMIASRPDETISIISDFVRYYIKPLNKEEASYLIKKLDNYKKTNEFVDLFIGSGWHDYPLIPNMDALLSSPLLITLFMLAYKSIDTIPSSKYLFYVNIFESYFNRSSENVQRLRKCDFSSETYFLLFIELGRITYDSRKTAYTRDEMIKIIKAIQINLNVNANPYHLLDDITVSMPFFIQESFVYNWVHKSFSEFFYANWIMKNRQYDYIGKMLRSKNASAHYTVLDLCYDINFSVGEELICTYILKKILNFEKSKANDIEYKYYKHKGWGLLYDHIKSIDSNRSFWGLIPLLRYKHKEIFKYIDYSERDKELQGILNQEKIYGITTRFSRGSNDEVYADQLEVLTFDACRKLYNKIIDHVN